MYREGQEGTPFHTMLVEGFVDGPVDVCKSQWSNHNVNHRYFTDKSNIIEYWFQHENFNELLSLLQVYVSLGRHAFTKNGETYI